MKKLGLIITLIILQNSLLAQDIILSHGNNSTIDINENICNIPDISFQLQRTQNAAFYDNKWIKSNAHLYRDGDKIQKAEYFFWNQGILNFSEIERKSGAYKAIIRHKFLVFTIKKEESNEINVTYFGEKGTYNSTKVLGRLISGNFDNSEGADLTAIYDYNGDNKPAFHTWINDNYNSLTYQGDNGWLKLGNYNPNKITDRVITGDFDNDGKEDDIAALYDYGDNKTTFHVFTSDGSKFISQGTNGFLVLNSYNANKVTGRVVAGDFDNDGFNDDIAALYDYGDNKTTFHVFTSDGSKFISQGTNGFLVLNSYDANKVIGRVVAGDFDNDGFNDDIAALYDYGDNKTTFHVFTSNGSKFISQGTNGWLVLNNYNASKITGIVTGKFDLDEREDIITLYDYGCNQTRIHTFLSQNNNKFQSQGSFGWWHICNDDCK